MGLSVGVATLASGAPADLWRDRLWVIERPARRDPSLLRNAAAPAPSSVEEVRAGIGLSVVGVRLVGATGHAAGMVMDELPVAVFAHEQVGRHQLDGGDVLDAQHECRIPG